MSYLCDHDKTRVLTKLKSYCSQQPRSHSDVKQKLYGLGLWTKDVEEILSLLIEENYVNEGKFAHGFVLRKNREGRWGKAKIKNRLWQKNVSEYNIKLALQAIDEESYAARLYEQAKIKWHSITGVGSNWLVKMQKTRNFLLQKGYESTHIGDVLNRLKKEERLYGKNKK